MKTRHAIITGASRGIGLCLAQNLLAQGAVVSNLSRTDGGVGTHFITDMTADPVAGLQAAIAQNGVPDLLILNAGIALPGILLEMTDQGFHEQMQVNFFANVALTRAAVQVMCPGSHIVFICSGAAYVGIQGHAAYCASKFALRGFAEALRGELRPSDLTVSIAYPPNTDTEMFMKEQQALPAETLAITSLARTFPAEDVARDILKGLRKGQFEIPIGVEMRLMGRFHSLFKPLIFWRMDRLAAKVRGG
ncbi:MAG: SDR family NAD(P)-dependent oxidoreductase [Rhodobacteraceae bacterium]|nr:SDR family NAD(P)-dependent oxidoreductase [Paracoccaceae bacterium]